MNFLNMNIFKLLVQHKIKLNNSFYLKYSTKNEIAAGYKPEEVEKRQLKTETTSSSSSRFSFILPPPNVTGNLHLGHALMCTVQDVIARSKRQTGCEVVWIPGTDHAGIATQVVVEKKIKAELNVSRHDLGREKFLKEVWKWKHEKGANILHDLRKLGASLSWDREYFTMDSTQSKAVIEAFIQLYNDGLIYRGNGLVNWSCSLESAISDIEVDTIELTGPTQISVPGYEKPITFGEITDISYKIHGIDSGELIVSTTRPETMLGDVAVAVNPADTRYTHFLNNKFQLWHPFRNEVIPVIADDSVDPEFGTGAVKITPAHDKNDFEMAKRHNLPMISMIDEKGCISIDSMFKGMPRFVGRHSIKMELAARGLLRETKPHAMQLPVCSRSNDVIEYMLKPQWFVDCHNMAQEAASSVKSGELRIIPDQFEKEWLRWLSDSRDWCVSRQLWWGHQIPAYEVQLDGKTFWRAGRSMEEVSASIRKEYGLNEKHPMMVTQDTDVLDTWFSSALLPFSLFGWPEGSKDFEKYYPLDLMATGHDILFFWVARMVMMGKQLTGQIPFREILLHGVICDAKGRKMSKSIGNVILPDHVIDGISLDKLIQQTKESHLCGILTKKEAEASIKSQAQQFPNGIPKCGADALRWTLSSNNIKNHFINFDVNDCYAAKLFFNKIWQATRYTLASCERIEFDKTTNFFHLSVMDQWILNRLADTLQTVEKSMTEFNFHLATSALKTFFYTNFCDVYLETTKPNTSLGSASGAGHCAVLIVCLQKGLQAMSPFAPFLTAELLQYLPDDLHLQPTLDRSIDGNVNDLLELCAAIRQLKSRNNINRKHHPKVIINVQNQTLFKFLFAEKRTIEILTRCEEVVFRGTHHLEDLVFKSTVGHLGSFGIETSGNLDAHEMIQETVSINKKKLNKLKTNLGKMLAILDTEGYRKNASQEKQKQHIAKIEQLKTEINAIQKIGFK